MTTPASAQLAPGELARVGDHGSVWQPDYEHWLQVTERAEAVGPEAEARLRPEVMSELIEERWVDAEAARFGITVSSGAFTTVSRRLVRQSFPSEQDFQNCLRERGETVSDVRERVRFTLLSGKI